MEDHVGFNDSIQKIHLEYALILAKEVGKAKQLSYTLIEQVAEMRDNKLSFSS
ncbi:hypothetical protein LBE40_05635 [Bartonella taylorii]|uniref:Uncharacterized protein n=1 Tax=Bartonella taylorii 8TBB TaxID=1094560 RepID=A0A9P2RZ06_BARTA|nr:hypothetical protein [Bartonella taylorii]EJF92976.1 hypothetical protein ME9_01418 [Bartonella taylorii 8TBB]USP00778.1 hypothetical protein LBE40_05635 [Bartonella taylorii]